MKIVKEKVIGAPSITQRYIVFAVVYTDNYYGDAKRTSLDINFYEKPKEEFYPIVLYRRKALGISIKKTSLDRGTISVAKSEQAGPEYGKKVAIGILGQELEYIDFTLRIVAVSDEQETGSKQMPEVTLCLIPPVPAYLKRDQKEAYVIIKNGSGKFSFNGRNYRISFPDGVPPYKMTASERYETDLILDRA